MRNKIITIRSLIQPVLFIMLILVVGLLVAFLTLAWFEGVVKLPAFLIQPPSNAAPLRLVINVLPADARITIDEKPYDPDSVPVPGDYVIRVTREGYLPAEEIIHIHPNQINQIDIRLIPIVTVQPIAEDATAPGWDQQGNLVFLNSFEGKIYKWLNGSLSAIAEIPGDVYQLIYSPAGTNALALISLGEYNGNKLYKVNLQTGALMELPITGISGLGDDGETIWGININPAENADKPVWSLPVGGNPKYLKLENSDWAIGGEELLIAPSGQWLAIKSARGVAIWEITSGKLVASFENAFDPVWVQIPQIGLAFLGSDNSLMFAQANLNWTPVGVLTDIQSPIASMPGSSEIIFSRYNPFAGGSSFWAVDIATMSVRLLSEAKVESGRVNEITISSNGKKLAFVNQKNILYLVVLEQ
jgi:hypothetical protein